MPGRYDSRTIIDLAFVFVAAVACLVLVGLADIIFSLLDYLVNRGVSAGFIARIILFKIPSVAVLFFPVAALFSAMMVTFRLVKDNEALVYGASGVTHERLIRPVVVFGCMITFLSFMLNELIVPSMNFQANTLIQKLILKTAIPVIEEQVFFRDVGNRVFYISKLDRSTHVMSGVMIYETTGTYPKILLADQARWDERTWTLTRGKIYRFSPEGFLNYEALFDQMKIKVNYQLEGAYFKSRNTREMSITELSRDLKRVAQVGLDTRALQTELNLKWSLPFINLVFAVLGATLILVFVRSSRDVWGLIIAVILTFSAITLFFFVTAFFRAMGIGARISPTLAAWMPNGLFLMITFFLWARLRLRG